MNWLLTVCDGSSGYKTIRLLSQEDAATYVAWADGLPIETVASTLDALAKTRVAYSGNSDFLLSPVPPTPEGLDGLLDD